MKHTALGLFRNGIDAEKAVTELKASGFLEGDLCVAAEPRYMPVSGPLSTPGMDFCEELALNLRAMGVPESETQAYILSVRDGGALVFANGSEEQVKKAADIMNANHAARAQDIQGIRPDLPELPHDSAIPRDVGSGQAGRVRYAGNGARMFAW